MTTHSGLAHEHNDPAELEGAATHTCTCSAHTITRTCPVGCLATVLSAKAFNPLARACDRRSGPGATVGHVVELYLQHQLSHIDGLGPRRIGEIEVGLIFAGLIGADSHHQTRPAPGTTGRPKRAADGGTR